MASQIGKRREWAEEEEKNDKKKPAMSSFLPRIFYNTRNWKVSSDLEFAFHHYNKGFLF